MKQDKRFVHAHLHTERGGDVKRKSERGDVKRERERVGDVKRKRETERRRY